DLFRCPDDPLPRAAEGGARNTPPESALYASYQYRGGLTLEDRPDIPIAADWSVLHNNGCNVLFLSGSVKWLRPDQANWAPVAPGPRPLPPGTALPPGAAATPFLNSPRAPAPTPGGSSLPGQGE